MKKITIKVILLFLLASPLSAVDIYKDETSTIDLSGRIVIMGSNSNAIKKMGDLLNLQNGDSRLRIAGEHIINESLTIQGISEWGFNALASSKEKGNFMYNRYGYIVLAAKTIGNLSFGKVFSPINDIVFATTVDKLYIGTNDAGATSFTKDEGSDYGIAKARKAITYDNTFGDFKIALQFQGKDDLESYYDDKNNVSKFKRKYGAGAAIKYSHNGFEANVGYLRANIQNKSEASNIKEKDLTSNAYVSSVGYNNKTIELGLAGGYYQNYQAIGTKHVGTAAYAAYHLNKIMPYVSYDFVYGVDIKKEYAGVRAKEVGYSFDRSNLTLGALYSATEKLYFAVEYAYDLRKKKQIESSYLAPNKSKELTLYLRYNI